MKQTIVLVDMMNLAYRAVFAHQGLQFNGRPTGLFYGVLNTVQRLRTKLGDNHRFVFCWDRRPSISQKPNWRYAIFPRYKESRTPNPDLEYVQNDVEDLFELVTMLGYQSLYIPGMEADDIMGLITATHHDRSFLLYSTDRDLYQLAEDHRVEIYAANMKRNSDGPIRITRKMIEETHGVTIAEWPRYLAMGGDSSDDIHVLKGVGPKTAKKFLEQGVDPRHPWKKQPEVFRDRHLKWKAKWPEVQAAYQVALIPRMPEDRRIASYMTSYSGLGTWTPIG